MNIQYYKLRLLGQPFRCGGGGGGGGGGGDSGDGGTGAASSATGGSPGPGAAGTGNGTDGGGDPGSVGVGEVGAASPGAGGAPAGPGDPGISDSSGGGLTASEQASLDAQAAADAAASAAADAAAAAAASAAADAAAAAAHAASPIGQAQNAIANQSLSQDQAAQAAMSLSAITGMSPMDSMMAVTDGFGTAPGLSAQGPSHSSGISFADIAVAQALGLGNQDVNSGQTVNQALAAAAVHSGLNNNIGQVMGAIGGPVVGMIATAANAVAQGHSVSSVVGQIAASIVGTAISNATGLAVNANTVNAIASGQIGQAAMGLAIGQVAQSTGLSIGTVTAAMSGNLGAAVANSVMGQVVGAAAQAMSAGPLGGMAIGAIASQSGIPSGIASSINQSAIGQAVNSATSAINSSISSAGIGVPGGAAGISAAVSAASSGSGASAPSQGDVLTNAVNSGSLANAAKSQTPAPGAPAGPSAPSKSDKYWQNLYSDLGMEFSKPPAQKANNTANEMYANQAKAQALMDAEREYTDIFGKLTPDVAAAISSAPDPVKYVDGLYTTDAEARDIWRKTVGTEPTEFDLMEIIGLDEGQAGSIVDNRANTSAEEATAFFRDLYGKDFKPTEEQLQSVMGPRPEAAAKADIQNIYTKDKNWVTEDEAQKFWKDSGNKGEMPQSFMDELLMTSEAGAKAMSETYRIRKEDLNATTFDGTKYKDQKEAQNAAIKAGYNNYTFGDKNYYLMSPDQAETLKKDIAEGKTTGPKPDAFFTSVPGMSLEQQLAAAGNPTEYAYQQGDTITVVGKRMEVPSYNDLEAWNAYKEEKAAAGGDNFQSFLTEQFSILEQAMKGAPEDSIAKVMADAAMFGYGKMAQVVEAFSRTGEAMGIPQAERGTNIAKQVQSWSKKLVDQGIQNAESAVLANVAAVTKESIAAERGVKPSDISTAELYAQKTAALFKQVPNNPLGVSLFLVGEGIQEIPLLAVSGGVGSVFKNVIGKSVGLSAAVGTNVALNGAESFGGNYGEVKEYLTKQGVPASQIEALAVKSGLEGMAVGMLTSYVGDRALVKSFMGDLATDSFGKVIATNSTKEWFLGNFEGSLQNMSAQIGKYGSIKSEDEWLNAGIMEGFAQKGIAAGVLTADALSQVVAKDYDGKPVTYQQIISGEKTFDPKTIDKSFGYGTGVNLGDAIGYHSTFITNPDITPDEYFYTAQTFRQNGMTDFTPQEIASIVGGAGELSSEQVAKAALPYAQERVVTKEEAQQMMRDLGYTNMTDAEAMSLAGQISEAAARENVRQYVDPRQVTREEAEKFFESIPGYKPTEEDISAFIRQGKDVNQEAVKSEIEAYVDPRMVTEQEVRDAYAELGLDEPTQADIDKLIGQYQQEELAGRAQENLGTAQFNVTTAKQEAVAKELADLEAKTTEQYNSLTVEQKAMADALAAQGVTLAEAIATAKSETQTQISELEAATKAQYETLTAAQKAAADALVAQGQTLQDAITAAKTETAGQIADVETRLTDAIAAAEAMGLTRDQAITAAVESVAADLGTTKDALLTQLGTTEAALRTEFATSISGLEAQTKAQYDALTAEQKALADALTAQGTTLSDAIAAAQEQTQGQIGELTADVQAKFDALTAEQKALATSLQQQGVDLNTAIETAKTQTQQQITDLGVEVDARINELMQQGQTYQQATQQAFAEVNAKNQEMAGLIGTQGRTASQQDIDALTEMLGGQRSMDLAYDVTGDKQITQADIDFLTQVVGGTKTDWTAPQESPWAATGLYGQIQANELRRQQDLAAAEAQRVADQQAAAQAAAEQARQANIRTTATRAQTSAQGIMQQLEAMQRAGMTPQQPAQLVEAGPGFDVSAALNTGFFSGFQAKKEQQNQQPTTKIAAGGYIDDLLAGDMTADDLLNLLR